MADEERRTDGPSLELPSLSFGRKRRKKDARAAPEPPAPPAPEPEPAPSRTPKRPPAPELPEPTPPPLFADEVVAPTAEPEPEAAVPPPAPAPAPVAPVAPMTPAASTPTRSAQKRPQKKPRRRPGFTLPALGGTLAAVVTGILVGVITVGVTWASLRVCEVVRGTSSCGGPGLFLLVAILLAAVLVGAALLKAAAVPQPGSTSFLAVGLLSVVALLFLVGSIFEWWMVVVVPLVSVATFLLSHWVTTTYIEPEDDPSDSPRQAEKHDVR